MSADHLSNPAGKGLNVGPDRPHNPHKQQPVHDEPDEMDVQQLAYKLWVERGSPDGSPDEDWFRAKQELNRRQAKSAGAA